MKQKYFSLVRDFWFCEYRTTIVINETKEMIWVSLLFGHDATSQSNRFPTFQGTDYLVMRSHNPE